MERILDERERRLWASVGPYASGEYYPFDAEEFVKFFSNLRTCPYSDCGLDFETRELLWEHLEKEHSEALCGKILSVKSRAKTEKEGLPFSISSSEPSGTVEFPERGASELSEQPLKGWFEDIMKVVRAKGYTSFTSRSQIGKVVKWNSGSASPRARKLLIDGVLETLAHRGSKQ